MKTNSILSVLILTGICFFLSGIELKAQDYVRLGESEVAITEPSETIPGEPWPQEPFIIGRSTGRSNERNSSLMLSKRYEGQTVSTKGEFKVESTTTRLRLSISGEVNHGSITVSLLMPDDKVFKTITINSAADVRWSENLNIEEGETMYHGTWKYEVSTKTAEGYYRLSINTG
jgi:hypothetical protein